MIIAGTGHRPQHIPGNPTIVANRLKDLATAALKKMSPDKVISGMAIGWDMALAQAAVDLGIPLIAAVPFVGQECRWRPEQQDQYHRLLKASLKKHILSPRPEDPFDVIEFMHKRDKWMVDNCDILLAFFSGKKGGTKTTVDYAIKVKREVVNLWPSWVKFSGV